MSATKKVVRSTKLMSAVYTDYKIRDGATLREYICLKASLLGGVGRKISISFNSRADGAYTTVTGKSGKSLRIMLGGQMVAKITHLPDEFNDKAKMKPYVKEIVIAILGLFYHEMGHDIFTDMYDRSIVDYKEPKYIGFLHNLFNIMEDAVIEMSIARYCKTYYAYDIQPSDLFNYMIKNLFMPQADEYKDDGQVSGFLNYLLLMLRCGRKNIKGNCAIFTKYESGLMPQIKSFLTETDGTERVHKAVALGEWIIENIKEFDWSEAPEPEGHEKKSGSLPLPAGGGGGAPVPTPAGSGDGDEIIEKGSGTAGESESAEEGKSAEDEEGGEEKKGGEERPPIEDSSEDEEVTDDVFNDIIHEGDDHEWVIAKDDYEYDDKVIERLDDQIQQFIDTINDVSKFLKLFKGRIKPRDFSGFSRGKFDVKRAIANKMKGGCDVKLFKQSVKRGQDADLAVSLLCDNSGSMSGTKSALCSRAALTLAQACDWAGIPFECNCFTKTHDSMDGTCVTITEKSFTDTFEKAKPYFAINDSGLLRSYLRSEKRIPTFCGNSEEINLYYIWKKFAKVDHRSKLLIVMCDGATTGSESDLKDIVRKIEAEDGIIVLGIGIMCHEVADIYPHHKLFNSEKELSEDLATYLVDVISKYAI